MAGNDRGDGNEDASAGGTSGDAPAADGDATDDPATLHERVLASPEDYPDTWVAQVGFRERYDLPPFRPPRFADGTPVDPVVEELEERHDVRISFVLRGGMDRPLRGTADWTLEVDGRPVRVLGRSRDADSNTVVAVTGERFRELVARHLETEE